MKQTIVPDSCVIIKAIDDPRMVGRIRVGLKGRSIKIVLCDQVLKEVQEIKNLAHSEIIEKTKKLFGKAVHTEEITHEQRLEAEEITRQFRECHKGDSSILSLCRAKDFVLITTDRMLLTACNALGVQAFHPTGMRGL